MTPFRSDRLTDFIARLGDVQRNELLRLASVRLLNKGELVFQAGSPGDFTYFLEEGRVKIFHQSPNGKEVVLWFCASGEIFGLAEVCQGGDGRQVTAQACEPSKILAVRREAFQNFLEQNPSAALLVNDVLACRLRSLGNVIQSLVENDVNERVAQLLARLIANYGRTVANGDVCLDIRITHQDMANMIGTTRQSVTSALNLLRRQGVLEFDAKHRILVHDGAFLADAHFISGSPLSRA